MSGLPSHGTLKTVYYQRRAADEPPDAVTYCSSCPLDTTSLKLDYKCRKSDAPLESSEAGSRRQMRLKNVHTHTDCLRSGGQRRMLVVNGSAAKRCLKLCIARSVLFKPYFKTRLVCSVDTRSDALGCESKTLLGTGARYARHSDTVAPMVQLVTEVDTYFTVCSKLQLGESVGSYEPSLRKLRQSSACVLRCLAEYKSRSVVVLMKNSSPDSSTIFHAIEFIMLETERKTRCTASLRQV